MPVYFGKPLVGTVRPPPEFAARNIQLLKANVQDAGYRGLPFLCSALYTAYIAFLGFFMQATVIRRKVHTSRYFHGTYFRMKMDAFLPFTYPDIVVAAAPGHSAELDSLAQELGGRVTTGKKGEKKASFGNIDRDRFAAISGANVITDTPCDAGRSNLDDFKAYLVCIKLATAFLMTHYYPSALAEPDDRPSKRTKLEETLLGERGTDPDVVMGEISDETDGTPVPEAIQDVHFKAIVTAYPSPEKLVYHGSAKDVPHLPGLLFPYFAGSILTSYSVIVNVVKDYFFSSLGEDQEECAVSLRAIRKASSAWAQSEAGLALQHLYAGIRLAIESESRLFAIIEDGEYHGYALLGYGFSVVTGGEILVAKSSADLQAEVAALETRSNTASTIVATVREMVADSGYDEEGIDKCPKAEVVEISLRPLRKYLMGEVSDVLNEGDNKDRLLKLFRVAYQKASFWRINATTINKALWLILDEAPVDNLEPFHVTDQFFNDDSHIHEVMAVFGPTAFSLLESGGIEWAIPRRGEKDVANEEVATGSGLRKRTQKALPVLPVLLKPLRAAIADMGAVMKKRVVCVRSARAQGQKSIVLQGADRDSVWEALKELFIVYDDTAARKSKGKAVANAPPVAVPMKRKVRDDFL